MMINQFIDRGPQIKELLKSFQGKLYATHAVLRDGGFTYREPQVRVEPSIQAEPQKQEVVVNA